MRSLDVLSIFVHNLFVDGRDVISFFFSDNITQFHNGSRECFETEIGTKITDDITFPRATERETRGVLERGGAARPLIP